MTFSEWWKSVAAHRMTWSRRMAAEYAWDAARADIEAVLVSKHGGEPLSLLAELDACRDLARTLEREIAALRALDKDGPCYYCGKQTNSLAGNPAEWCVVLSHADEPGVSKAHHAGCINERLAAATRPVEGEVGALIAKLNAYNPPDRTVAEQRQISVDIHNAASLLERLARERDEAVKMMEAGWLSVVESGINHFRDRAVAAERALTDAERKLHQFVTLAKAQGIEVTIIECGDENSDDPH